MDIVSYLRFASGLVNAEGRQRAMQAIRKREALLAWALKNGDKDEAKRIRTELDELFAAAF